MGLDTSHNCWHGPYSSFMRWRMAVCKAAGLGDLLQYEGFGLSKTKQFDASDPLTILLWHSDCDGEIAYTDCTALARRLEEILPKLDPSGESGRTVEHTRQFIAGLLTAAKAKENVDFR